MERETLFLVIFAIMILASGFIVFSYPKFEYAVYSLIALFVFLIITKIYDNYV
ncbi:MAG: hypothetical protein QW040_02390 [Candidatus Aenigmatarchaeota archaeon]